MINNEQKPTEKLSAEPGQTAKAAANDDAELLKNVERIRYKIVVLSGKGGVGKSTIAVNCAAALAARSFRVGLLDVDIHGPSIPTLLGLEGARIACDSSGKLIPVRERGCDVMSIGFLMQNRDSAVIWRGPLKYGVIKQFLKDVAWGELDFLVIDSPPGTGDEPLAVCQMLPRPAGALIVTTPQGVAIADVRKSITFCRQVDMPIIGVIENMSGFVCPSCGATSLIFKQDGGRAMAEEMSVPFLGSIPLDPAIVEGSDAGTSALHNPGILEQSFSSIMQNILKGV